MGQDFSVNIHINLEVSVVLYRIVKWFIFSYPSVLLHGKADLYRECSLNLAQTKSHHIYIQFLDSFQFIHLHLKGSLSQCLELLLGRLKNQFSPCTISRCIHWYFLVLKNMVNADIWNLDKQNKPQIMIKRKEFSSWPCIKCLLKEETEGQSTERHIRSEVVALKGKILWETITRRSATPREGLENPWVWLFLFNIRKAHPM